MFRRQKRRTDTGTSARTATVPIRALLADSYLPLEAGETDVQEYQRKQLLERIDRESATLGVDIPERIDVQGQEVNLHEFVFEIKRLDRVPKGERERVEQAKKNLRRERLARRQRIESADITFEEGEALADAIIGIDRALEALGSLGPSDVEAEAKRQEAADTKRWMNFLKQALGRDDSGPGVRHR